MWTTLYRTFITLTIDIIQPYLAASLTKEGGVWSTGRVWIIKRTTNDACIIHIPWIVTNCSPWTIVEYLNPTLSVPTSSNKPWTWERINCCKMLFFYMKVFLELHKWVWPARISICQILLRQSQTINWNKNLLYCAPYLNKWLMHLYCDHSYVHSIHCVNIAQ